MKKSGNLGVDDVDIDDMIQKETDDIDMEMDAEEVDIQEYELNHEDDEDPFGEGERDYD